MEPHLVDQLAELIAADTALVGHDDYSAVTFVVRAGDGWWNHFGFRYHADGTASYFCLASSDAFRLVRADKRRRGDDWRVFTATIRRGRLGADIRTYRGAAADAWFVALGREDDVADLARPVE